MKETAEIYLTDSLADEPREEYYKEFPLKKVGDKFQLGGMVSLRYEVKKVVKDETTGKITMFAETF